MLAAQWSTQVAETDVRDLTLATATLLQSLAKKSGVEIVADGTPAHAMGNRAEIQQVLTNLITNAIHAMPRGGALNWT